MLEVVGERVGGWCGRDTSSSLRQAVRARKRQQEYSKLDSTANCRKSSLFRIKEGPVIPAPEPQHRPPSGLACGRCAPVSRVS
ncbi:hypothetical protein HF086_017180 [Spodoptera exigua]|uniref:Uncharacterized protein n=1 Tax=Spodoptera exigua TaxID=7107 RepID=A0A922ME33_SPOEX|nr:hypothetical protein HF086_017180 [Spodoptera exigua]